MWICAAFSAIVGFSRIYTGMHSFTDVIAGAVLGGTMTIVYWHYLAEIEAILQFDQNGRLF